MSDIELLRNYELQEEYPVFSYATESSATKFSLLLPLVKKIENETDPVKKKVAMNMLEKIGYAIQNYHTHSIPDYQTSLHKEFFLMDLTEIINDAGKTLEEQSGWKKIINNLLNGFINLFVSKTLNNTFENNFSFFSNPIKKEADKIKKQLHTQVEKETPQLVKLEWLKEADDDEVESNGAYIPPKPLKPGH